MYVCTCHASSQRNLWVACMCGCVKHVVDLDLTVARTGPRDGGAGGVADAPRGPEVGEHAPEGITTKDYSRG